MRLICVSGFNGSGKTSLVKALIQRAAPAGKRSAVIVNESGKTAYEEDFMEAFNVPAAYIRGG